VALVTTADPPNTSLLDAGEAARRAAALAPRPWAGDRARAVEALAKTNFPARPEILWLSDGIEDGQAHPTNAALARIGNVRVFVSKPGPLVLLPPENVGNGFALTVLRAGSQGVREGSVQAQGAHGEVLGTARFRFEGGQSR